MKFFPSRKQDYAAVPNDAERSAPHKRTTLSSGATTCLALLIILNMMTLAWAAYGIRYHLYPDVSTGIPTMSCDCGTTINEAVKLGCKFDTLSASWLPLRCRDDELTAEFDRSGPDGQWTYWADREQTRSLTIEQVGALAVNPSQQAQVWTTFGWHVTHCSFYWRKEHRMRMRGLQVEGRYNKESHIKHCHMAFMARTPLNVTNTMAFISLGGDGEEE
ncbi:hypothetical protein E4U55_004071 [Claviceps digitariae]|nr:hypothetical protein E4U55_004071 [Claviceps digitariae]